jgi:1,4-dihydroxy-6-naphthoate synthase
MMHRVKPEQTIPLRIGHSPDPDDAFMWWPLAPGDHQPALIDTGRFRFQPVLADIETLNQRAESGELEITAMSCAQFPAVQHHYSLTSCGSSMGDGYGPKLVAARGVQLDDLTAPGRDIVIAVPGERTSAFAAMSLMLGKASGQFRHEVVPFERIVDLVVDGTFQAGLVIHEGQLTFAQSGLNLLADLGAWWREAFGGPLPLGVNAIRRDLDEQFGEGSLNEITAILVDSVNYALSHRDEALRFALRHARGLELELADQFVDMYVNRWSIDFGPIGEAAVQTFLGELARAGFVSPVRRLEFVRPAINASAITTCRDMTQITPTNLSK